MMKGKSKGEGKKDSFYSRRLYPLVFMLVVTVVCITITSGLFLATRERVEANETLFLKKTVLEAADVSYPEDFTEINRIFSSSVDQREGFYIVSRDSLGPAYVLPVSGPGLWGTISLMVGFEENLENLTGIGIVSQNETPGLGARIEEEWFKEQFAGKWGPFTLVEEGTADEKDEIDGITGATRTSRAMQVIMNKAVAEGPGLLSGKGE